LLCSRFYANKKGLFFVFSERFSTRDLAEMLKS